MEDMQRTEKLLELPLILQSSGSESKIIVMDILRSIANNIEKEAIQKMIIQNESQPQSSGKRKRHNSVALATAIASSETSEAAMVTVDNLEDVFMALNRFQVQYMKNRQEQKPTQIPKILDGYLEFIARQGWTHFPWPQIKLLFKVKLMHVLADFHSSFPKIDVGTPNVEPFNFSYVKDKLFHRLEHFSGVPFTVQRIAELLLSPRRYYKTSQVFLIALEKNLLIVSTIGIKMAPPIPPSEDMESTLAIEAILNASMDEALNKEAERKIHKANINPMSIGIIDSVTESIELPTNDGDIDGPKLEEIGHMEMDTEVSDNKLTNSSSMELP